MQSGSLLKFPSSGLESTLSKQSERRGPSTRCHTPQDSHIGCYERTYLSVEAQRSVNWSVEAQRNVNWSGDELSIYITHGDTAYVAAPPSDLWPFLEMVTHVCDNRVIRKTISNRTDWYQSIKVYQKKGVLTFWFVKIW